MAELSLFLCLPVCLCFQAAIRWAALLNHVLPTVVCHSTSPERSGRQLELCSTISCSPLSCLRRICCYSFENELSILLKTVNWIIFSLCVWVSDCVHVCALHVCRAPGGEKRALGPLGLGRVGSCHMGAGNQTLVFWKSIECSSPPSHFWSPQTAFYDTEYTRVGKINNV